MLRERRDNLNFTLGGFVHPSTVFVQLESNDDKLSVFSDRSHGISSPLSQSITVFLQRRLNCTNSVVLNEPLNDTSIVEEGFELSLNDSANWKKKALMMNFPSSVFVSDAYVNMSLTSFHSDNIHVTVTSSQHNGYNYVRLLNIGTLVEKIDIFSLFLKTISNPVIVSANHIHEKEAISLNELIEILPDQILTIRFKWGH